jgi:hypothetical protein
MGLKLSGDTLQDWDLEQILDTPKPELTLNQMIERLDMYEMFGNRDQKNYFAGMKLWDK